MSNVGALSDKAPRFIPVKRCVSNPPRKERRYQNPEGFGTQFTFFILLEALKWLIQISQH